MVLSRVLCAALLLCAVLPGWAADFSDPTWPCEQRKVERLSVGLMWPHPISEVGALLEEATEEDQAIRTEIASLAEKLAVRRIEVEDLRPDVVAFAARHSGDQALLGLVFEGVFERLSKRRSRIISGIGKFSLSQITLSERIKIAQQEMDSQMAQDNPDFDRIDALQEQLDWDQLIYSDRQKSITYLCETPVLLEKRLYAISQLLQSEIRGG